MGMDLVISSSFEELGRMKKFDLVFFGHVWVARSSMRCCRYAVFVCSR